MTASKTVTVEYWGTDTQGRPRKGTYSSKSTRRTKIYRGILQLNPDLKEWTGFGWRKITP